MNLIMRFKGWLISGMCAVTQSQPALSSDEVKGVRWPAHILRQALYDLLTRTHIQLLIRIIKL